MCCFIQEHDDLISLTALRPISLAGAAGAMGVRSASVEMSRAGKTSWTICDPGTKSHVSSTTIPATNDETTAALLPLRQWSPSTMVGKKQAP